jgi:hypothetical protein
MAAQGKKGRKVGRHDRTPSKHTPSIALHNKAKRILQSSGAKALVAFAELHKLLSLAPASVRSLAAAQGTRKHDVLRDERRGRGRKRAA